MLASENGWTEKYKRALLERNPALLLSRIEDAREAMTARIRQLSETADERQIIDRAFYVLAMISVTRSPHGDRSSAGTGAI